MSAQVEEIKFLKDVDTSWLVEAVEHLVADKKAALGLYVWVKRLQEKLDEILGVLKIPANAEFAQMRAASSQLTKWACEDFAVLTNNAARGSWSYPPDILAKQAELDDLITQFQSTHKKTHFVEGQLDPAKAPLFKVSIMR